MMTNLINLDEFPYWNGEFTEDIKKRIVDKKRVKIILRNPDDFSDKPKEVLLWAKTHFFEHDAYSPYKGTVACFTLFLKSRQVMTAFAKLGIELRFYDGRLSTTISQSIPSFDGFSYWYFERDTFKKTAHSIAHPWHLTSKLFRGGIFGDI